MVEQLDVPLEKLLPIIHAGRPIASLDAGISKSTYGLKRSQRIEDDRTTLHDLLSDTSEVTPGNDLEDVKKAIDKALSGLNETERIAVGSYLEMNLNDVSAETTYPLATAVDIFKDWARARLRSLIEGHAAS